MCICISFHSLNDRLQCFSSKGNGWGYHYISYIFHSRITMNTCRCIWIHVDMFLFLTSYMLYPYFELEIQVEDCVDRFSLSVCLNELSGRAKGERNMSWVQSNKFILLYVSTTPRAHSHRSQSLAVPALWLEANLTAKETWNKNKTKGSETIIEMFCCVTWLTSPTWQIHMCVDVIISNLFHNLIKTIHSLVRKCGL